MEERDVVNIGTKFKKGLIARFIKRTVKSQLGIHADIELEQLFVQNNNGMIQLDIKVHGEMAQSELPKILKLN